MTENEREFPALVRISGTFHAAFVALARQFNPTNPTEALNVLVVTLADPLDEHANEWYGCGVNQANY